MAEFRFRFAPTYRLLAAPFGVRPSNSVVVVTEHQLDVRFGAWRVRTPLENIAGTERTGPYQLVKTAGPAHLSFADRGLTFATNSEAGLCIRFQDPVTGIDPFRILRHPGLTVTVEDLDGLEQRLHSPA
jgi:hypothetical protein